MIKRNNIFCLFVLLFFILWSFDVIAYENVDIDDTYNFDGSSKNDQTAFENYDFDFQVSNLYSNADLVCFNFDVSGGTDNYGGEDYCVYTSTSSRDDCISCWAITVPLSNMGQKSSLFAEIINKVCDGCTYDTSNRFGDTAIANIYYNCDACASSSVIGVGEFY